MCDEIVSAVRRIRKRYAARFDHDSPGESGVGIAGIAPVIAGADGRENLFIRRAAENVGVVKAKRGLPGNAGVLWVGKFAGMVSGEGDWPSKVGGSAFCGGA